MYLLFAPSLPSKTNHNMRLELVHAKPTTTSIKGYRGFIRSWSSTSTTSNTPKSTARMAHRYSHVLKPTISQTQLIILFVLLLVLSITDRSYVVFGQSSYDYGYDDDENAGSGYSPRPPPVVDNLYHDYAARQEAKVGIDSGAVGGANGGLLNGWVGTGLIFVGGWWAGGYFHSRRTRNQLNVKFKKEQKELYQQYYNDVYSLQQQNAELINALEQYLVATQGAGGSAGQMTTTNAQRRVK